MSKPYRIEVAEGQINKLLREVHSWGIGKQYYEVDGNTIITKDSNVVNIAREFFSENPELVKIEKL